ncbi:hypothetical protein PAECIP112173_01400 [Paenibacillus sp. JJ-100]|uniref:DUF4363 family protein n=1 Tax=Paenibacillus sp. JJ-100 TaxID=2974896 RepID=UPI0022FF7A71|nr:DUF4363 family protein [Paenibacillus sp. JJ-100]CAI6051271.1 hypothetical protein PAECIP112173_01400 [Paenibacillus sp. JJ-100]
MKKKTWLLYAIPILMLLLFISIMVSGPMLKKPLGKHDRLLESVHLLEKQVQEKQWTQAKAQVDYAMHAWDRIVNRIQFSVERESIYDILGALARMKGGIAAKDDQAILEEIYYFYALWDNLGN